MNIEQILTNIVGWATSAGIKVVISLLIIAISFPIIDKLTKVIKNICIKRNVDKTVGKTLRYVFKIAAKIVILSCLLGYLGIDTASISALIATVGVGFGLAVQGSLSNLAGGIVILLTRPFKVDDYIEAQGISGTVTEITIIYTIIKTPDNKVINVPNGSLANGNIINYSTEATRRVDFSFSISYAQDFRKAQKIVTDICNSHELILKDHDIFCRISAHNDSCLTLTARVWCNSADYWTIYFDIMEQVKTRFDEENIEIPFPQLDVHIDNK